MSGHALRSLDGRRALAALVALVAARALLYAAFGAGLVLDDWTSVGNREFLGIAEISNHDMLLSRPLAWLVFTGLYGVSGPHPLALLFFVTLANLAAVSTLYLLVRRYFMATTALMIAAAWVIVPNHNAMTVWAANAQSVVAFVLLAGGAYLLSRGHWVVPALAFAGAVLGYQLTILPAAAGAVLIGTPLMPLVGDASAPVRSLRLGQRAAILGAIGLASAWAAAHPNKPIQYFGPGFWDYVSAHFGEGLFAGPVADPLHQALQGIAVVLSVLALVAYARGERGREDGPLLVLAGGLVMGLGSLGVLLNAAELFGMTDRNYAVSSVGGVMVWVGLFQFVARRWRPAAFALAAVWCVVCLFGQVVSLRSWSRAGDDVVALLHHLDEVDADPDAALVVGPYAVRRNNVTGIVSPVAPDNALWLHRGAQRGSLRIAKVPSEFVVLDPGEVLVEWTGGENEVEPEPGRP